MYSDHVITRGIPCKYEGTQYGACAGYKPADCFIDNNACKYIGELREVSPGNGAVIVSLKQCGDTVSNVK